MQTSYVINSVASYQKNNNERKNHERNERVDVGLHGFIETIT